MGSNVMTDTCRRERGAGTRADHAIRLSTAGAVLTVAGVAAYISYWHAYAVVREFGEVGITARLEPATIDGLVYACSMVMLYAARHRRPVPSLARWLLALGIAATLAANMAQGWSHGPVGAVVAAWPAASLVGSYELLVWIIRTSAVVSPDQEMVRASGLMDQAAIDQGQPAQARAGLDMGRDDPEAAAVALYAGSVRAGKPLSERKLGGTFGRSRRWARARMAESQAEEHTLAAA